MKKIAFASVLLASMLLAACGDERPASPGLTRYVHFAYADSADGTANFTTGQPAGRTFVGSYTDQSPADSTSPGAYSWAPLKPGAEYVEAAPYPDGSQKYIP